MTEIIHLSDRAVAHLAGEDTEKLLQGLITNNMTLLATQPAFFSALLSPQGKFLHDFFVVKKGNDWLLETEERQMQGLLALLTKYRLRAKVQFSLLAEWHVYAGWGDTPPPSPTDAIHYPDLRHGAMGWRMISPHPLPHQGEVTRYHQHRIHCGIPEGWHDLLYDKSFVLEYGYDTLHAIDFAKGCYVGQEVTARGKHRGVIRKGIYNVQAQAGVELPAHGTAITTREGSPIGEMRSHIRSIGLALCRHEEYATALAQGTSFMAGDVAVQLSPSASENT